MASVSLPVQGHQTPLSNLRPEELSNELFEAFRAMKITETITLLRNYGGFKEELTLPNRNLTPAEKSKFLSDVSDLAREASQSANRIACQILGVLQKDPEKLEAVRKLVSLGDPTLKQ